ncbi:class I SAM-dependent methyltransferase [Streptomyces sp. NPDC060030]|uniref:class I SAM-dependent methyltransferase n=1 Tax=Streptomyces sp. NPDC060030 TaxID=3347042 RepID=UPI0036816401
MVWILPDIDAVGRTAFAVAALRAAEHRSANPLFTDPYAEHFLQAAGHELEPSAQTAEFTDIMATQVAVRTRLFDDYLLAATERGVRQVVLLASGMDSRPWRLNWPIGTEVFDLDQGPVLNFKSQVMSTQDTPKTRRTVQADLRDDWTACLRAAGFDRTEPTAWLAEGILYALEERDAEILLATLSEHSATGSTLAFDHFQVGPSLRAATDRMGPGLTRLWQTGPRDPAAWLARHGWQHHLLELADVAAGFDRTPHPAYNVDTRAEGHSWLVTAQRSDYEHAH